MLILVSILPNIYLPYPLLPEYKHRGTGRQLAHLQSAMDINRFNFWHTLPAVLEALTASDYVAVDLEMTGISGGSPSETLEQSNPAPYHQALVAARTFQVLQIGLTCLCYNPDRDGC